MSTQLNIQWFHPDAGLDAMRFAAVAKTQGHDRIWSLTSQTQSSSHQLLLTRESFPPEILGQLQCRCLEAALSQVFILMTNIRSARRPEIQVSAAQWSRWTRDIATIGPTRQGLEAYLDGTVFSVVLSFSRKTFHASLSSFF